MAKKITFTQPVAELIAASVIPAAASTAAAWKPDMLAALEKFPGRPGAALCKPAPLRHHRQGEGQGGKYVFRRQLRHDQGRAFLFEPPWSPRTRRAPGRISVSPWRRRSSMPLRWIWAAAGSAASSTARVSPRRWASARMKCCRRLWPWAARRSDHPCATAWCAGAPRATCARRRPAFFRRDWGSPLASAAAGPWATVLESVRLAPSASNKQPWRMIRQDGAFHFFLDRDKAYSAMMPLVDLQRIDMGIAMCHFQLAAAEAGSGWRVAGCRAKVAGYSGKL